MVDVPATQKNFKWYRYVDDSGRNWGIRVDSIWGDNVNSGLAAFNVADPPFGPQSRRHRPRVATYTDPTTFRTTECIVGTQAALAALPATLAVIVPGETAAVTYNLTGTRGEKLQKPATARNLGNHA